jgi:hypothetical protein
MRGIERCREGTCGVAGYLVEGKQKEVPGSPLLGKPDDVPKPQLICLRYEYPIYKVIYTQPT